MAIVQADGSIWFFVAASTAAAAAGLVIVPNDAPSTGRWLHSGTGTSGGSGIVDLKLAIGFATANAAVLATIPTDMKALILRAYWEVTTSWTGGASSAIGISSSDSNYSASGSLLGGASGDVAATLVSTGSPYKGGTLGSAFGSNGVPVLVGGDNILFNRITSAFTAGAGYVHFSLQFIN
jgi:hypothetical protein